MSYLKIVKKSKYYHEKYTKYSKDLVYFNESDFDDESEMIKHYHNLRKKYEKYLSKFIKNFDKIFIFIKDIVLVDNLFQDFPPIFLEDFSSAVSQRIYQKKYSIFINFLISSPKIVVKYFFTNESAKSLSHRCLIFYENFDFSSRRIFFFDKLFENTTSFITSKLYILVGRKDPIDYRIFIPILKKIGKYQNKSLDIFMASIIFLKKIFKDYSEVKLFLNLLIKEKIDHNIYIKAIRNFVPSNVVPFYRESENNNNSYNNLYRNVELRKIILRQYS